MTRAQRARHRVVWFVLVPLLASAIAWAWFERPADPRPPELRAEGGR